MKKHIVHHYVLFVGICLLGGMLSLLLLTKGSKALPLGEVLDEDFDDVTKETSALLGDIPELNARTTLVTCLSTYDLIFYVEVQVVQLWITPTVWKRWRQLSSSGGTMRELTPERMIPIWREVAQTFLPTDSSYLYWNYPLKNGWRVSMMSASHQAKHRLIPVLVVFRRPGVR